MLFLTLLNNPRIVFNVLSGFFMILGNSKELMLPSSSFEIVVPELKVCLLQRQLSCLLHLKNFLPRLQLK